MMRATVLSVEAQSIAAEVPEREYRRLLGLPRRFEPTGDLFAHAQRARAWYADRGRPFLAARRVELSACSTRRVVLATGDVLESEVLAGRLRAGGAHALVVMAASAGHEAAAEAARSWNDGRPDEGFFLDRFAAAIAEALLRHATATIRAEFLQPGERLLAHCSPGCGKWPLDGQSRLATLLGANGSAVVGGFASEPGEMSLGPVTLLASGALRPQHSMLAALGVTRRIVRRQSASPCRRCDLERCRYRRVPHCTDQPLTREAP